MKQYIDIFFSVWSRTINELKKPLGFVALILLLGVGSYLFGFWQRSVGYASAKKDDSTLVATKDFQIKDRDGQISLLNEEKTKLQTKIDSFDCAEETERWSKLFQTLQASLAPKKVNEARSLEAERRRTEEIQKAINSL